LSEINEVLGDKEGVSVEDLEKLQFTEQVNLINPLLTTGPVEEVSDYGNCCLEFSVVQGSLG